MKRLTPDGLRAALINLGLSQRQAAKLMGVDHNSVFRWVAGLRQISGPVDALVRQWLRCKTCKKSPPNKLREKLEKQKREDAES